MAKILAIDEGTSSVRALIFSDRGEVLHVAQQALGLVYPHDGWVEQDPREILDKTLAVIRDVMAQVDDPASVVCAGITNQRETVIIWDKHTGQAVYNAIVWQDRRMAGLCRAMKADGLEESICAKTGLVLDPYFSASKIKWILDNVEGVRQRAENGDLLCGTVDCYVLWHLTGGQVHLTDVTNASRTMLFDIGRCCWDEDLAKMFDVPLSMLPEVQENIADFGVIGSDFAGVALHVGGVAGDQQAALIGQGCIDKGAVKATYGTGCFMLMNIGEEMVSSEHRLLTTIGFKVEGRISYALEGAIFNAGTAVQFLRDNFGFFEKSSDSEAMAVSVCDHGGVYFVPAFTGLGAPYWQPDARGVLCGLSRDTRREHVVRAALEAQAYQTRDLMDAMQADSGVSLDALRADGGLVANGFMCQFLADILGVRIEVPRVAEATAWGAACLAGVRVGVFADLAQAAGLWQAGKHYESEMDRTRAEELYAGWKKVVAQFV